MDEQWISTFAANGPWALAAAFLLHQVIKAWTNDRQQLNGLLTDFKDALIALKTAVEELKTELRPHT